MKRTTHDALILGGEPRVNLLPPEVADSVKTREVRRTLIIATIGIVGIVVVGIGAAAWHSAHSQLQLAAAQANSAELLTEQAKYVEVRQVQNEVDIAVAARRVGSYTEVDWKNYLQKVRGVLPADVTIGGVVLETSSPLAPFDQPTAPLQAPRAATLSVTVGSPTLPQVPEWLEAMQTLPGFADAVPGTITKTDAGTYTVSLTIHINSEAFSRRFDTEPAEATDPTTDETNNAVSDSSAVDSANGGKDNE